MSGNWVLNVRRSFTAIDEYSEVASSEVTSGFSSESTIRERMCRNGRIIREATSESGNGVSFILKNGINIYALFQSFLVHEFTDRCNLTFGLGLEITIRSRSTRWG